MLQNQKLIEQGLHDRKPHKPALWNYSGLKIIHPIWMIGYGELNADKLHCKWKFTRVVFNLDVRFFLLYRSLKNVVSFGFCPYSLPKPHWFAERPSRLLVVRV